MIVPVQSKRSEMSSDIKWILLIRCPPDAPSHSAFAKITQNSFPSYFTTIIYECRTTEEYFNYERQTQLLETKTENLRPAIRYALIVDAGMVLTSYQGNPVAKFPFLQLPSFMISYGTEERQGLLFSRIPVFRLDNTRRLCGRLKPKLLPVAHKAHYIPDLIIRWQSDAALAWTTTIELSEIKVFLRNMKVQSTSSYRTDTDPIQRKFQHEEPKRRRLSRSEGAPPLVAYETVKYKYQPGHGYTVAHIIHLYHYLFKENTNILELLNEKLSAKYRSLYNYEKYQLTGDNEAFLAAQKFYSQDLATLVRTIGSKLAIYLADAVIYLWGRTKLPKIVARGINFVDGSSFLEMLPSVSMHCPVVQRPRLLDAIVNSNIWDHDLVAPLYAVGYSHVHSCRGRENLLLSHSSMSDHTPLTLNRCNGYYWLVSVTPVGKQSISRIIPGTASLIAPIDLNGREKCFATPTRIVACDRRKVCQILPPNPVSTDGFEHNFGADVPIGVVGPLLITDKSPFKFTNYEDGECGTVIGIPRNRVILSAGFDGALLVSVDNGSGYQVLQISVETKTISYSSPIFNFTYDKISKILGFANASNIGQYSLFVDHEGSIFEYNFMILDREL